MNSFTRLAMCTFVESTTMGISTAVRVTSRIETPSTPRA